MKTIATKALVVGGGTSGVCAAIQAARSGAETLLIEEGPWLGGMLTAAGVSATDGNHLLPSGLWGEFRSRLTSYYGGPGALGTGWVSHTQFEPHVGNEIFHRMVEADPKITLIKGFWPVSVRLGGNCLRAVEFRNASGESLLAEAQVIIDATEYGDVLALAGVPYSIGREAESETGEPGAPEKADGMIQDITLVACLKDFGAGADKTIPAPPGYDAKAYYGCCKDAPRLPDQPPAAGNLNTMLNYGRLPNGKYMINWPAHGNDFYANLIEKSREERAAGLEPARWFTLGFVHFIQTVLGKKNLGLAEDEFPTEDHLALIPYNRESRRMKGAVTLRVQDLADPYAAPGGPLYRTGVAVGDYPLDHHHTKCEGEVGETYLSIPSFTVPLGCMIPEVIEGLIVAEHSISVTHMVNGCTRLQPCVMLIGQAAGAAAALCVRTGRQPREIDIRSLQQMLLDARCWLMPFRDILPRDWEFQAMQRVALSGVLEGTLFPDSWSENKILIYPERPVEGVEAAEALCRALGIEKLPNTMADVERVTLLTRSDLIEAVWELSGKPAPTPRPPAFDDVLEDHPAFAAVQYADQAGWLSPWAVAPEFHPANQATRAVLAVLLDRAFDPFHRLPVSMTGR